MEIEFSLTCYRFTFHLILYILYTSKNSYWWLEQTPNHHTHPNNMAILVLYIHSYVIWALQCYTYTMSNEYYIYIARAHVCPRVGLLANNKHNWQTSCSQECESSFLLRMYVQTHHQCMFAGRFAHSLVTINICAGCFHAFSLLGSVEQDSWRRKFSLVFLPKHRSYLLLWTYRLKFHDRLKFQSFIINIDRKR